jgi:hypothetical protein
LQTGGEGAAMRYWYKANIFRDVADTVFPGPNGLIEEYLGSDNDRLIYPNVSTCTTVSVLLANDTLVGTHLSAMCTKDDIDKIVARMKQMMGAQTASRVALLGVLRYIGGTNQRGGVAYTSEPEYAYPAKLETFAGKFGVDRSRIAYYDQGMRTEKHYQVRAVGGGNLATFYQDVGKRTVGQGTASKPFSSSDPWMSLTTLDFVMI